jgi:hypothetical protein
MSIHVARGFGQWNDIVVLIDLLIREKQALPSVFTGWFQRALSIRDDTKLKLCINSGGQCAKSWIDFSGM